MCCVSTTSPTCYSPVNHVGCSDGICPRLNEFWAIVAANKEYLIEFSDMAPGRLQFSLPNAPNDTSILLKLKYSAPVYVEVFVAEQLVNPITLIPTLPGIVGEHYIDHANSSVYLIVKGDTPVEIVSRRVIQIELRLDATLDWFNPSLFIRNISRALSIQQDRVEILAVRQGSVIVTAQIRQSLSDYEVNNEIVFTSLHALG